MVSSIPRLATVSLLVPLALLLLFSAGADAKKKGGKPDLRIKSVKGLPSSAESGASVTAKVKVQNAGKKKAKGSKVTLYLSTDAKSSKGDDKISRSKKVPKLKPRKSAKVTVPAELEGEAGEWFVVACASAAKKEKKKGNNCGASKKLAIEAGAGGSGEPFPESFEGTFSVSFTTDNTSNNETRNTSGFEQFQGTMTGDLTLTREPGGLLGGSQPFHYESSGELEWGGSYTSQYMDEGAVAETCSGAGTGTEPIVPFAGNHSVSYGWVNFPTNGNLAPGSEYFSFGSERSAFEFSGTCMGSDAGTFNGDRSPLFPAILPRSFSDDCTLNVGTYVVKPNGNLSGTDSCRYETTLNYSNGTEIDITLTANWSWDLAPVSAARATSASP